MRRMRSRASDAQLTSSSIRGAAAIARPRRGGFPGAHLPGCVALAAMDSDEQARLARLERQMTFLFQHLGLNPAAVPGESAASSTFGSPADISGSGGTGGAPAATFSSPAPRYGVPAAPGSRTVRAVSGTAFSDAGPAAPAAAIPVAEAPGTSYPPALMEAIQRGKMIDAIKIYRQLTHAGLKEAKAAVDAIASGRQP